MAAAAAATRCGRWRCGAGGGGDRECLVLLAGCELSGALRGPVARGVRSDGAQAEGMPLRGGRCAGEGWGRSADRRSWPQLPNSSTGLPLQKKNHQTTHDHHSALPPKAGICHFDEDTGTFVFLSVPANAQAAHLSNHARDFLAPFSTVADPKADDDGDGE